MKTQDALEALKTGSGVAERQFALLQAVAREVTADPKSRMAKELVLRALEHRDVFTKTQPILSSLVRETGLFPYLDDPTLSIRDLLALEFHRPEALEDIIFHQEQALIYHKLLAGKNVVLSAPTSFGKSKIIDAVIATCRFTNVVVIVPTLALLDETRRRLQGQFSGQYHIVGHPSQQPTEDRNIFIFTPERVVLYKENFPKIDFFVLDEFYKIGGQSEEDRRVVALNEAFYYLYKKHRAQFYMLGPNIQAISEGASQRFDFEFISTDFQTVVADIVDVRAPTEEDRFRELVRICRNAEEPTLIYCKSIPQVNRVAEMLLDANIQGSAVDTEPAADWLSREFHPDWVLPRALHAGIGIHYGPLPRSIAHEMVRFFNGDRIQFLICTSTLIEGVNTKAKNVVIFENKIARKNLDYFTFNNIKGRSGRMFEHFVGRVFQFHKEPEPKLPFVGFPLHSQDKNTPEAILIQMDEEDLEEKARERVKITVESSPLPINVLRENHGIEPGEQTTLAVKILSDLNRYNALLAWSNLPKYEQLKACCDLIWDFWIRRRRNDISSAKQLTLKLWQLSKGQSLAERIENELKGEPRYAAKSPSEAVERLLRFDRNWAGFDFPQYLMALDRIQRHIFTQENMHCGNYSYYAGQVESLFLPGLCAALDEYGIPATLTMKCGFLRRAETVTDALSQLGSADLRTLDLHSYEVELLESVREGN
uniref:Helicase conserved C-terminal domain-containing protein n=1 Tax=Candidatus Kentrum sp. LFY TaxID=2126342 RepID=A0A450V8T5_9GAMM|nr:MAG: Helicase conserved C-terminal domain-containing protein [Candidatus Kentron sp. LFY]